MKERKKIHKFKSKILAVEQLTTDVIHITISIPPEFEFYTGQFVTFFLDVDGKRVKRPYSIASKPSLKSLEICIKILPNGLATPTIGKLKVGDEIEVLGPMGAFLLKDESKTIIFVSTGTGIGPFRSMILDLLESGSNNKIVLISGYRYEEGTLYEDELKELETSHQNFSYQRILSRPISGEKGYVQNIVQNHIDADNHYYICGLKEMTTSVRNLLLEKGISDENIFFEDYD